MDEEYRCLILMLKICRNYDKYKFYQFTGNDLMNPVFGPGQYRIFLVLSRAEKAVLISAGLSNPYDICSFYRIRANLIILFNKNQYS